MSDRNAYNGVKNTQQQDGAKINYYRVLSISPTASAEEITRAWRKAVLLHHPDKAKAKANAGRGVSNTTDATSKHSEKEHDIRLINEARWILGDVRRRREWEQGFNAGGESFCCTCCCSIGVVG